MRISNAGHVARTGEWGHAYRILVGRPAWKRPFVRPRCRWDDNIKIDIKEIIINDANWIRLAQNMVRWRAFVSTGMNIRFP
jgi:hypothetical protein